MQFLFVCFLSSSWQVGLELSDTCRDKVPECIALACPRLFGQAGLESDPLTAFGNNPGQAILSLRLHRPEGLVFQTKYME